METAAIFVRPPGAEGLVYHSIEGTAEIRNVASAFPANLRKTALKAPVFSVKGGTRPASAFPVSRALCHPKGLLGELMVPVNGADFTPLVCRTEPRHRRPNLHRAMHVDGLRHGKLHDSHPGRRQSIAQSPGTQDFLKPGSLVQAGPVHLN